MKVLVLDDGSMDGTVQAAKEAGADKILSHVHNLGLAITFRDALDGALEMGADIIVNIDADGQYDPQEISKLVQPVVDDEADIVLGSRFDGYIEDMPASKKLGNRVATRFVSRAAGKHFSDAQTGFRAFSRDAAMRLNVMGDFTYTQRMKQTGPLIRSEAWMSDGTRTVDGETKAFEFLKGKNEEQ